MNHHGGPRVVAAGDLGSHTFCLVIARAHGAQAGFRVIDSIKEHVSLATELDATDGSRAREAIDGALAVARRLGERIEHFAPDDVRIVGTSALRLSDRGRTFRARLEAAIGFPVELIGGEIEAALAYRGVVQGGTPRRRRMVVDVGGASTELAIGDGFDPDVTWSEALGHVERTRALELADGTLERRYRTIRSDAVERWSKIAAELSPRFDEVIGTSGILRAIADLVEGEGAPPGVMTRAAIEELERRAIDQGEAIPELAGLSALRAPTFLGGLANVAALFDAFAIERLTVSERGLRDGIVHSLLSPPPDLSERTVVRLSRRYGIDPAQAERVARVASSLLPDGWALGPEAGRLLDYGARLHELGQAVTYRGYHKEGARLLRRSSLAGFSREQRLALAALVRLHRPGRRIRDKHLRRIPSPALRAEITRAVLALRLAVLLCRARRDDPELDGLTARAAGAGLEVECPAGWLEARPLTIATLTQETREWKRIGVVLSTRFVDTPRADWRAARSG
ncbi:MAG: hypothetical protein AB7S26_33155 [Sandaracinaceae bacterium]